MMFRPGLVGGVVRNIQGDATADNPSGATAFLGSPDSLKLHDASYYEIGSSLGVYYARYDFGRARYLQAVSLNELFAISTSDGTTFAAIQVTVSVGDAGGTYTGLGTVQTHGFGTSGVVGDDVSGVPANGSWPSVNGFYRYVIVQHTLGNSSVYIEADSLLVTGI